MTTKDQIDWLYGEIAEGHDTAKTYKMLEELNKCHHQCSKEVDIPEIIIRNALKETMEELNDN